ncbi:MAG: hypothetical protein JNK67_12835 [Alphaproteobacteria bacterium]|nr:hypothetical protein [Alphaproteobacteria bacterium]
MSGWDVFSIGTYLLGKSDFASTRPDGTPIMSGEGRLQSMGGVTIWLHADLDEAEHDLALLAAFSQAFLIVS